MQLLVSRNPQKSVSYGKKLLAKSIFFADFFIKKPFYKQHRWAIIFEHPPCWVLVQGDGSCRLLFFQPATIPNKVFIQTGHVGQCWRTMLGALRCALVPPNRYKPSWDFCGVIDFNGQMGL